ncbi:MAG: TonB-dependent receptor [Opitutales bacterium]|nr:TonB-dependent receptor [Opitutales bacterium]
MNPKKYVLFFALFLSTMLVAPLTAQDDEEEDIYSLQPFTVTSEREEGYRATTTISASRLNLPLEEVPINIPVLTADYIQDIAANTQREALLWHSGVEGKSIRGFDTAEFYRNGFQHLSDTQGFLIQRMEVLRGPTAILSGPVQPGGGINVITKAAVLDTTFGEFIGQHTFGEGHTYQNVGIDINNGELGPKKDYGSTIGFRFIGAYQHDSGRARDVKNDYPTMLANLVVRPFEGTRISFEYYYYDLDSDRTDHHLAVNNGGARVIAQDGGRIPIYAAYNLPYYASWNGPDGTSPETLDEYTISLNQKLGENLYLDISFNNHDRDLHFINTASHGGITGGFRLVRKEGLGMPDNGNPEDQRNYVLRRGLRNAFIGNVTKQLNASISYNPEINGEKNHRFQFGYQTYQQERVLSFADAYRTDDPTQRYYQYFDPRNYFTDDLGVEFGKFFYDFTRPALDRYEENTQDTMYAIWMGKWFEQRLKTMVGLFQTKMSQGRDNIARTNFQQRFDGDKFIPQFGAVYDITPNFGIYAAYTKSSAINTNQAPPQDNPDFFFPPKNGEMMEIGTRFEILEDKVIGTIGIYEISQTDLVKLDSNGNVINLGDVESSGIDFDFFIYPTKDWTIIFNYAYNDKTVPPDVGGSAADANEFRSPKNKWSIWTKYAINEGNFKGVTFGGGFRWVEGTPFTIAGVSGTNPDHTRADVFIRKTGELTDGIDYTIGLNIRNLTGKANLSNNVVAPSRTYTGLRPGTNQRFEYSTDPEYMVTFGLNF